MRTPPSVHPCRLAAALLALLASAALSISAQRAGGPGAPATHSVRTVTWSEVSPIVTRLEATLPASLAAIPAAERPARWAEWVRSEDQQLARRLRQGDVDSVVNLLLFGTRFTTAPRITPAHVEALTRRWQAGDSTAADQLRSQYRQRAADLIAAAASPRSDARMRDARRILEAAGVRFGTAAERRAAEEFLLGEVARVRQEAAALTTELQSAGAADPSEGAARRATVFKDRGLSADSSVLTQFAVDRALCAAAGRGTLEKGVRRVVIVGPGLDFTDKQEGLDFYPPQSLQPFTAIDSLIRCGLATAAALEVTTVDVSPRVTGHLREAVATARKGAPYRLVLARPADAVWPAPASEYWRAAGSAVGLTPPLPPSLVPAGVEARRIDVRPAIVRLLRPLQANIVFSRLDAEPAGVDLVIATNVLVYYDRFQQALALSAIADMLRPGGHLLTNDPVPELAEVPLRAAGRDAVRFSDRPGDGERMEWYQRTDR